MHMQYLLKSANLGAQPFYVPIKIITRLHVDADLIWNTHVLPGIQPFPAHMQRTNEPMKVKVLLQVQVASSSRRQETGVETWGLGRPDQDLL